MLPQIYGEFGVVFEPELRFSTDGKAWVKIRGAAKDRTFNADTKEWEDKGDPCYLDIVFGGKASENIVESVTVGDTITVSGRLQQREYEHEGQKRKDYQIRADYVGVGVRFNPAPTPKMMESKGGSAPATAGNTSGRQSDEAPF